MPPNPQPPLGPQRKRRFAFEEARSELLAAGKELLDSYGVADGFGRVTLSDAISAAGVPRPSAYRVFSNGDLDPQEEFRAQLLLSMFDDDGPRTLFDSAVAAGFAVVDEHSAMVESEDPDDLAWVLRQLYRELSNYVYRHATTPSAIILNVTISLATNPVPNPSLVAAHQQRLKHAAERNAELYAAAIAQFGLRLRPGCTTEQLAVVIIGLSDGVWEERANFGPEPTISRPTGIGGERELWCGFGIALEGLAMSLCESDPNAEVSARLASWLDTPE